MFSYRIGSNFHFFLVNDFYGERRSIVLYANLAMAIAWMVKATIEPQIPVLNDPTSRAITYDSARQYKMQYSRYQQLPNT